MFIHLKKLKTCLRLYSEREVPYFLDGLYFHLKSAILDKSVNKNYKNFSFLCFQDNARIRFSY